MDRLWRPWRMQYVAGAAGGSGECIFCARAARPDEVLYRSERTFVILNAYPYNTGHVMVAPYRHCGDLGSLASEERSELMEVTAAAVEVVERALNPQGFNVGMNLGRVAGAGVPDHVHVHVVPRWEGDTNFMTTVGNSKVLPEMLAETDARLRPLFAELTSK